MADGGRSCSCKVWVQRSRPRALERAINQGRVAPLTSHKVGFRYRNLSFSQFHCLETSSGTVVAKSNTYRTVSTFVVKFGPKCTDPQSRKDVRFTFHTRRAVQSTIADLLVTIFTILLQLAHLWTFRPSCALWMPSIIILDDLEWPWTAHHQLCQ